MVVVWEAVLDGPYEFEVAFSFDCSLKSNLAPAGIDWRKFGCLIAIESESAPLDIL